MFQQGPRVLLALWSMLSLALAEELNVDTIKGEFTRTANDTAEYSIPDVTVKGLQTFFKEADRDDDGVLRFVEYRDLMNMFYSEGDEDVREALEEPEAAQLLFYSMDSNDDMVLSYKEVETMLVEWFHELYLDTPVARWVPSRTILTTSQPPTLSSSFI